MERRPRVSFDELRGADLEVGAIYEGGTAGNVGDDPLARLMGCGNMGGFRIRGSVMRHDVKYAVLYTTWEEPGWPDSFDGQTRVLRYFGDNKEPGQDLHETRPGGNLLLRATFDSLHTGQRERVAPFFVFGKVSEHSGRDVEFIGVAVPGAVGASEQEDLVASWYTLDGRRFQNYEALFTVLPIPRVPHAWLEELIEGHVLGPSCPPAYRAWVETGAETARDGEQPPPATTLEIDRSEDRLHVEMASRRVRGSRGPDRSGRTFRVEDNPETGLVDVYLDRAGEAGRERLVASLEREDAVRLARGLLELAEKA